jgi:hypothetical protein
MAWSWRAPPALQLPKGADGQAGEALGSAEKVRDPVCVLLIDQ